MTHKGWGYNIEEAISPYNPLLPIRKCHGQNEDGTLHHLKYNKVRLRTLCARAGSKGGLPRRELRIPRRGLLHGKSKGIFCRVKKRGSEISEPRGTGAERIELPLRVLETPVMPFDQAPVPAADVRGSLLRIA